MNEISSIVIEPIDNRMRRYEERQRAIRDGRRIAAAAIALFRQRLKASGDSTVHQPDRPGLNQ